MQPELAGRWPAAHAGGAADGVALTVINFNTAQQTLRCLRSLRDCAPPPATVLVLDNASGPADWTRLRDGCEALGASELRLYRSETNLGFAAGTNFLIEQALADRAIRHVALLNNDAVARPALVARLRDALVAGGARAGIAGGRMHRLAAPDEVDTLGISLYASLMPADRKDTTDPLLGPTGGCCMLTRGLIEDLVSASGYFYDPRYFCYCEDTDVALRSLLLGYEPAYVDEVIALHEGQASTGTGYSEFITYHGIRNLVWMHWKLVPDEVRRRHAAALLLAHVLTIARHMLSGHPGVLWRLYRDAWRKRDEFRREHALFTARVRIAPRDVERRLAPRFYRSGYLRLVLAQILQRNRGSRH